MIAPEKEKGPRWWPVFAIISLAAANIYRVQSSESLDSNFKNMQTMLTIAAALVLFLLWIAFFSRVRWWLRLVWLALFLLLGICAAQSLRFDGSVNGTGWPNLTWKWKPKLTGDVHQPAMPNTNAPAEPLVAKTDYAGFLGSDRRGIVEGVKLDCDWANHPPKELWRQPVGLGWSAFAVAGSNAITQEQRGENELVVCYDLGSGQVHWTHTNNVRFSDALGGDGPRATPTIVAGRVYALGGTGILDCLELADGKPVWSRDVLKDQGLPNTTWGKSSSPLVTDDLVVVTGGQTNDAPLLAFHRNDGTPAWHAGTDKAAYASPALATLAGQPQILSLNAASLTAHDPADGHLLWKYDWGTDQWPKCTQPLLLPGDKIFISGSFGLGCVLLQVMKSVDGKLGVNELWKNKNLKSEFSTVVVKDNYLYGIDDGILACIDLTSGDRKWKDGRYGHGQILLAGDTLVVQTEPGPVVLVAADPNGWREIGHVSGLKAKTWNTPALAGEYLLVRNDQEAVCYKLALKESSN